MIITAVTTRVTISSTSSCNLPHLDSGVSTQTRSQDDDEEQDYGQEDNQ